MHDADQALDQLVALKGLGVRLAVDDFGTGYSSLACLQRFPIDALKIDKSFVSGLGSQEHETRVVEAIVSVARALDLRTIAEGVETRGQLATLAALGCDQVQGYLLGRPMPLDQLDTVLAADCAATRG